MNINPIDISAAIESHQERILHFFKISVLPQLFESANVFKNTEVCVAALSHKTNTKVINVTEKSESVGETLWARCDHPSENIYLTKEFQKTPSIFALLKPFFKENANCKNKILGCLMPGIMHDMEERNNVYESGYMQEVAKQHKLTKLELQFGQNINDDYTANSCSQIVCVFCVSLLESFLKKLFQSPLKREYFQNIDDLKKLGQYLNVDDIFDGASNYFLSVNFKTKNNLSLKQQFKIIFDYRHETIHENKSTSGPIKSTDIILIFYFFAEYISKETINKST